MNQLIRILFIATVWAYAGEAPPFPLGDRTVEPPVGRLCYRIGTYLTIEGIRAEKGKVGTQTLAVDTINGLKLGEPVTIRIENLELPAGPR
ncbi:MAG: hypothetical protein N3G20_11100 [Verrucomicrobiae bacterium]|nr:hypothetical protein [Verrucomicrobiae bacterium]